MRKPEQHCSECGAIFDADLNSVDPMRRFFFAQIRDAHANLPDHLRDRWPSSEHLRKHALIAAGHCDTAQVIAGSKRAALDVAALIKSMDRYRIVVVEGDVLTVYTARSMARRFLLKPQFREVVDKVMVWITQQTNIDPRRSMAA